MDDTAVGSLVADTASEILVAAAGNDDADGE
jgi:hypothetical protein